MEQKIYKLSKYLHKFFSLVGPLTQRKRLINVRFVLIGYRSAVFSSYLNYNINYFGNLCLGHGMIPNNYGIEYRKLMSYGMQNNISVLEKCPSTAATANVIPDQ
jgi:hypothetical protein